MTEFIAAITAFPTIFYTGFLGLALIYWIFVIVGAVDVDLFDPSSAADSVGALKGLGEGVGAMKGLGEGVDALKGAGDAAGDALGDGAAEALGHGADGAVKGAGDLLAAKGAKLEAAGETAGLLATFKIKDVPITVTGSLWIVWAWALSYLGMHVLGPIAAPIVGLTVLGFAVMIGAGILGFPVAAMCARPFAGLFATEEAQGHEALVGQIVQITTGRVDGSFGQANYEDGQGGLLLSIRCARENKLERGDDALIVDYDPNTGTFLVEPMDPALAADDVRRARANARVERERA